MPIQMVRRKIEQRCGLRMKGVHRAQLKAGELGHEYPAWRAVDVGRERHADVAAYLHRDPRRFEDFPGHHRRGALAVATGDANDLSLDE